MAMSTRKRVTVVESADAGGARRPTHARQAGDEDRGAEQPGRDRRRAEPEARDAEPPPAVPREPCRRADLDGEEVQDTR